MPWGIGTESLGMIGLIFAENGPLKGGIESSFSGTGWGAKGDFRWIWGPNRCIFGGGPPPFFRKHIPWGIGIESLGMIGCIFAENWSLESGIESSFSGTGWGAQGDLIRYSYLYPYIFESKTDTLFEITCPELYACGWSSGTRHIDAAGTSIHPSIQWQESITSRHWHHNTHTTSRRQWIGGCAGW